MSTSKMSLDIMVRTSSAEYQLYSYYQAVALVNSVNHPEWSLMIVGTFLSATEATAGSPCSAMISSMLRRFHCLLGSTPQSLSSAGESLFSWSVRATTPSTAVPWPGCGTSASNWHESSSDLSTLLCRLGEYVIVIDSHLQFNHSIIQLTYFSVYFPKSHLQIQVCEPRFQYGIDTSRDATSPTRRCESEAGTRPGSSGWPSETSGKYRACSPNRLTGVLCTAG